MASTIFRSAAALLAATLLLSACGGGGADAPDTAAPTVTASSYTQGPIDGFGSIIVGGVRFDDSIAAVTDDDGSAQDKSALKLGMLVQVDASAVDRSAGTGTALRIRFGGELVGPVSVVSTATSTAVVLGQTVLVTSSTVFDESLAGGLSAVTVGSVVQVFGILDTTSGRITATRIEPKAGATSYLLRGVVASLNTTAKTFNIGSQLVSYAGLAAADVPAGLANGQVVRATLQTAQVNGAWVATKLRGGARLPDASQPVRDARVEGLITAFSSTASFEVNGLKVDASGATFPDGTAGIVLGARVEVTGAVTNGVLVASKVELEDQRDHGRRPLALFGTLSNLDTAAKTFALRGLTVWYGGSVTYPTGSSEAALANGKSVEVQGVLSNDRTRLEATRIMIRN